MLGEHLTVGDRVAVRKEHRLETMPEISPDGPHQHAVGVAAKDPRPPIGPCDAKNANVGSATADVGAHLDQTLLNAAACDVEVPVWARPAARVNPWLPAQREHLDTGVIGQCWQPGGRRSSGSLEPSVVFERGASFLGFGEPQLGGGTKRDGKPREELIELSQLAFVVARENPNSRAVGSHFARSKGSRAGGCFAKLG